MDDSEKTYLANKHRGGENSKKGNLYEAYYAVFSILREMSDGHGETTISPQVEGAYVDDLLIEDGERRIYHQLKNQKLLSWGGMQHGDLKYDFLMQARICEAREENFFLKLVATHHLEELAKHLPAEIQKVASVEYYPMLGDFNQYAYYPVFASVAVKAIGCDPCEIDKVENVATVLLGLWVGGSCRGLNAKEVWTKMRRTLFGEESFDAARAERLCASLEKMGFLVQMQHGELCWKKGGFTGSIGLNNEKMKSLLSIGDVEEMIRNLI